MRSVQAYALHWLSPLSKSEVECRNAVNHVIQTIELASLLSAEHVIAVVCYGEPGVADPDRRAVAMLRALAKQAKDRGITIGLEPLDAKRTSYRPTSTEVRELVKAVNDEHLKLMLDTGHLWENKENIMEVLEKFGNECSEIHLKDSESRAPGLGTIDFEPVRETCARLKALKCLEYRPSKDPWHDFQRALETVGVPK